MTGNLDINANPVPNRVIESLRSGVPAGTAARLLGSPQHEAIEGFEAALKSSTSNSGGGGIIIEAPFGAGKSHLISNLKELALERNFAVSVVCVSKEMTLATITQVFVNAIKELRLPGKTVGGSCAEFVDKLRFDSRAFANLMAAYSDDDALDAVFGATLRLFESYQGQSDVIDSIIDFWDGGSCNITAIRRDLRAIQLPYLHLKAPRESSMGLDRLQFVSNLLVCAGYAGWAIMIDEGEMIAKLSLLARAKCYANLASLLGSPRLRSVSHIVTTLALTNDLWHELLTERDDRYTLDFRLRGMRPELAEAALDALDFLYDANKRYELKTLSAPELAELRLRVANLYREAYCDADVPALDSLPDLDSRSIRSHIKEWITDWDLRRLYRGYSPALEQRAVEVSLAEDSWYGEELISSD